MAQPSLDSIAALDTVNSPNADDRLDGTHAPRHVLRAPLDAASLATPLLVDPTPTRRRRAEPGREVLLRAAGPLAVLVLWSIASATGIVRAQTLAAPWAVGRALVELVVSGVLWANLSASLLRALAGLAIGLSAGLSLGLVTGLTRLGDQLLDPLLQMLRTVPFLAVAPLLVLWFGIGEDQKVLVIAVAVSFPFYLNTHGGVRDVDPKIIEAGQVFGLSRVRLTRLIILPGALPSMLVGLRQSLGIALVALIVAEQSNAPRGIGFLMMSAQQFFQTEVLLVCVLLYALWGLAGDLLVRRLERAWMPWRSARRRP